MTHTTQAITSPAQACACKGNRANNHSASGAGVLDHIGSDDARGAA